MTHNSAKCRAELGKSIRKRREELGLTWYAVAKRSGLTNTQVKEMETGTRSYTIDSYISVCRVLEIAWFSLR